MRQDMTVVTRNCVFKRNKVGHGVLLALDPMATTYTDWVFRATDMTAGKHRMQGKLTNTHMDYISTQTSGLLLKMAPLFDMEYSYPY